MLVMCKHRFCNVCWCIANHFLCPCLWYEPWVRNKILLLLLTKYVKACYSTSNAIVKHSVLSVFINVRCAVRACNMDFTSLCKLNSLSFIHIWQKIAYYLWQSIATFSAYNNAYEIMQYIPKNVNVHSYQVNHCVRTFDAFLKNNLYSFFKHCASSSDFYIHLLLMSAASYKPLYFLNYLKLLYGGEQLQYLLGHCFGVHNSSVLLLCSSKSGCVLGSASRFQYFCDSFITFNILMMCTSQTYKKWVHVTGNTICQILL